MKTEIRRINEKEKEDLIDWFTEQGHPREEAEDTVSTFEENMVTIEHFISQSPGYIGKIIIAVYANPSLTDVFIYEDGKLVRQKTEYEL